MAERVVPIRVRLWLATAPTAIARSAAATDIRGRPAETRGVILGEGGQPLPATVCKFGFPTKDGMAAGAGAAGAEGVDCHTVGKDSRTTLGDVSIGALVNVDTVRKQALESLAVTAIPRDKNRPRELDVDGDGESTSGPQQLRQEASEGRVMFGKTVVPRQCNPDGVDQAVSDPTEDKPLGPRVDERRVACKGLAERYTRGGAKAIGRKS